MNFHNQYSLPIAYILGLSFILLQFLLTTSIQVERVGEVYIPDTFFLYVILFSLLYLISIFLFGKTNKKKPVLILLFAALLVKFFLALSPVFLTGDIYRYLWEGLLIREGVSPYVYAPDSSVLEPLRTEYWNFIEYKHLTAIYPPLTEYLLGVFCWNILFWKLFLIFVESLGILCFWKILKRKNLPCGRILIYALLPLSTIEVASSRHIEGALILPAGLLVFSLMKSPSLIRDVSLGILGTVLFLIKYPAALPFFSIVLFLFFHGQRSSAFRTTGLFIAFSFLGLFPFLNKDFSLFSSLSVYTEHWRFNDSLLHLLGSLSGVDWNHAETFTWIKYSLFGLWALLFLFMASRFNNPDRLIVYGSALFLLCGSTFHPWYALWFAPLLCLYPSPALISLCLLLPVAYSGISIQGNVPGTLKYFEFGPVFLIFFIELSCLQRRILHRVT